MHQTSNQLQTITTQVICDNFGQMDLTAKLLNSLIRDKPTGTQNQASYFDETAYFEKALDFDELDFFAYHKSFDDAELGGQK